MRRGFMNNLKLKLERGYETHRFGSVSIRFIKISRVLRMYFYLKQ